MANNHAEIANKTNKTNNANNANNASKTNKINELKPKQKSRSTMSFTDTILQNIVNGEMIKGNQILSRIYITCILFFGVLSFTFDNTTTSNIGEGYATNMIWIYGIFVFSMFSIMMMNLSNSEEFKFSKISIESLITIILISWYISILSEHRKLINSGKTHNSFNKYKNTINGLIFGLVLAFTLESFLSNIPESQLRSAKIYDMDIMQSFSFIRYIFLALLSVLIMIQKSVLSNFSVDIL